MSDFDASKYAAYWRNDALQSWDDAVFLINGGRVLFGLFSAHLALEKALKALIIKKTNALAPRIHNLITLAEIASLTLTVQQKNLFADMNSFNIRGRYPEAMGDPPSARQVQAILKHTQEAMEWLTSQL